MSNEQHGWCEVMLKDSMTFKKTYKKRNVI